MYPGVSRHAFVTAATYYRQTAAGWERRDGQTNPAIMDDKLYDLCRLTQLVSAVSHGALAWALLDDTAAAAGACRLVEAWIINPDTRMEPSLQHTQIIPGSSKLDNWAGIIDGRSFVELGECIELLRTSPSWQTAWDATVRAWFASMADGLLNSRQGKAEGEKANNVATWYDVQVLSYAMFSGEARFRPLILETLEKVKSRIASQIMPDGTMPLEMARATSFNYTVAYLEAFTILAPEQAYKTLKQSRLLNATGANPQPRYG